MARALKHCLTLLCVLWSFAALAQQTGGACFFKQTGDVGVCAPIVRFSSYLYGSLGLPGCGTIEPGYPPTYGQPYGWSSEADSVAAFVQACAANICGAPQRMDESWQVSNWLVWASPGLGPAQAYFGDLLELEQTDDNKLVTYQIFWGNANSCTTTPGYMWKQRGAGCPSGLHPINLAGSEILPSGNFPSQLLSSELDICYRPVDVDPKNLGCCTSPGLMGGNPVNLGTGNKYQEEMDFVDPRKGLLSFRRTYNSLGFDITTLGTGWRHSFERSIYTGINGSPTSALVRRSDGKAYTYRVQAGGAWASDADVVERLQRQVNGSGATLGWTLVTRTDETETYDASGRLLSIAYPEGQTLAFAYSDASTPATVAPTAGYLLSVQDSLGRSISFIYDAAGHLVQLTDTAGWHYQYAYDAGNRLESVTYPDGSQRGYLYNEPAYTGNTNQPYTLTGIIDENGARFATFTYDSQGRATATEHAGGVGRITLAFHPPTFVNNVANYVTSITDVLGTTQNLSFTETLNTYRFTGAAQPCPSCGGGVTNLAQYDTNGNVSLRGDFSAVLTSYQYDLARNLEASRIEASGTTLQRVIRTQWHPAFRVPTQVSEPAPGGTKTTTFTYDGSRNLKQKSITAPKNDGTSATTTRAWNWTYNMLGRVATTTDPNGKVTAYTYYADNDSDLGRRGNVATITNAAGHVTQITVYDLAGRPLTTVDPNGLTTTLTYDPRGRLASRQVGVETTTYIYDLAGQLIQVTQPDGSYLHYTYDAAHRLIGIDDGLGNAIDYTLDAMGNRLQERVYDPVDNLARTHSRTIDALNRLASDVGALGQTTAYTYDANSNLLTVTDPLTNVTVNSYDALYRMISVLDPYQSTVKYAYDLAGNLTQVTDQRNQVTSYTYDGLNGLTRQISPDTGTTTFTYDPAGNLLSKTDARGAIATYTYDNLNRSTQIVYSKTGNVNETHSFTYDTGANAKGRLSQIVDPAATTSWSFNSQGRVSSKTQQIGGFARTLTYGYNAAGQLSTLTTPSGQVISYGYSNNRVSTVSVNGQSLLTGAATEPFGPLAVWVWGNGLKMWRDYDNDGRMVTWEFRNGTAVLRKDQSFDLANRIISIADPINPPASQSYQYDALDRLIVAQTGSPVTHTQQFIYDEVGNRQNATTDGSAVDLFYSANSNQLQSMSGAVAASYLNGATALTLTYNNANRLVAVQRSGSPPASYAVNALGQRVSKTVSGVTTVFVYDEEGHLRGEYDGSGNLIEETVWVEDLPVATLRPTGAAGNPTPISVYYVHADHLGSPRAITRPSDNALVWQWDNLDPFGANAANENPTGQGPFRYNLRFPGQYYDAETGTHYNYFRDYDPSIGRYEQSDPLGLRGSINTYAYVSASPLRWSDQYGLEGGGFSTRYGNWCGKNWSGGKEGPRIPENPGGPIDSVDECCMKHDYCWAKYEYNCDPCGTSAENKAGKEKCNQDFVRCTKKLEGMPPRNWPKPPPPGKEVDAYFFCQKAKWWFQ